MTHQTLSVNDVFFPMGSGIARHVGAYFSQMGLSCYWTEHRQSMSSPEAMATILEYAAGIRKPGRSSIFTIRDAVGGKRILPLSTGLWRFNKGYVDILDFLDAELDAMRKEIKKATVFLFSPAALPSVFLMPSNEPVSDMAGIPRNLCDVKSFTFASGLNAFRRILRAIALLKQDMPYRVVWVPSEAGQGDNSAEHLLYTAVYELLAQEIKRVGVGFSHQEPFLTPLDELSVRSSRLRLIRDFIKASFIPRDVQLCDSFLDTLEYINSNCPNSPVPNADMFFDPHLTELIEQTDILLSKYSALVPTRMRQVLMELGNIKAPEDNSSRPVPMDNRLVLPGGGKFFIWGTGGRYRDTWAQHMGEIKGHCLGFIDNNLQLHGQTFEGLPVFSPDQAPLDKAELVIVASHWKDEITKQLRTLGFYGEVIDQPVFAGMAPERGLLPGGRFLVWGTGDHYTEIWGRYMPPLLHRCIGFVDSDPKKQGTLFEGLPVFAPDRAPLNEVGLIVIASRKAEEIRRQLRYLCFEGQIIDAPPAPVGPGGDRILIWGTGGRFRTVWAKQLPALRSRCLGFIDNNPDMQGRIVENLPVYAPERAPLQEASLIIIASQWKDSITLQLRELGYLGEII